MNTREIAAEYRLSHWERVMRERQESGLSIRAFCKNAGFHENVYYYWQRKLRETACEELALRNGTAMVGAPAFAEVRLPPATPCTGVINVRMGDVEVEIAGNASPTVVEAVLRTLGKC